MAIYELVLTQTYLSQRTINRFNYYSPDATGTSNAQLLTLLLGLQNYGTSAPGEFDDTLSFAYTLQALQSELVSFNSVYAFDIYNDDDFFELAYPAEVTGTRASPDPTPPFVSYGFRTNRITRAIRRSTKRFPGVVEADTGGAGAWTPAATAQLGALAGTMGEVLTFTPPEGATTTFNPCTVSKEPYIAPSGRTAYRYYEDESAQEDNIAFPLVWEYYPSPRSQVSRQVGRGI